MAETLIRLVKNIQNELRTNQKKNFNESSILEAKICLLQNNLKNEFSSGIKYNYFLEILNNEIINCILFDLVLYDYVVFNIGVKMLKSLIIDKNIQFNKTISIPITLLKPEILDIVSVYFYKEDIVILFEYSDDEGRMIVKNKNTEVKSRSNVKFIKFPLFNLKLLKKNNI